MDGERVTSVKFASGIVKELTPLAAEGYWTDGDKIRFRFDKPELMGGWLNVTSPEATELLIGQPRVLDTARALDGTRVAVIGTNTGFFSSNLSLYYNITPLVTTIAGTNRFSTSVGSTNILVSISAHGLTNNTFVGVVSAGTTIGGNVVINAPATTTSTFQVSVVSAHSFELLGSTTAAATSAATGGAATFLLYYNAGAASNSQGGGWGGGVWSGNFGWGDPTGASILSRLRTWSTDQWGTEIMAVPSDGPLFLYSPQNGITSRPVVISAAPSVNRIVRVASEARHVILYGTHDVTGTYDPLLIRWCSQEDYDDWTPTLVNTSGDFRLNSEGSEITGVLKMRDQMLIFTDYDMYLQSYIGANDVFGFSRAARNCGLIAQNGAIEYGGAAYWMSNNGQFYKYDGRLQPLSCTVLRYVYDNLSTTHRAKIYAGSNSQFDEVIWFYCSEDSTDGENDRYVIYNTLQNHWTVGSMRRTTWKDRSTYDNILATGVSGAGMFYQETGFSADTSALDSFVESSYFDMQDGDAIMFCDKYIPDIRSTSGGPIAETITLYLKSRKYPGSAVITKGPYTINSSVDKVSTRLRGREFALRLESATSTGATPWRNGEIRMAIQADGKR
jgi:hypothetical protein